MANSVAESVNFEAWDVLSEVLRNTIAGFFREPNVQRYLGRSSTGVSKAATEQCLYHPFATHLEKAIASHLASQLAPQPKYAVDSQLRTTHCGQPKIITVPHDNAQARMDRPAHPNLIVHVPGPNEHNLLAIELRREDRQDAFELIEERKKMYGYIRPQLSYRFALYLCLAVGGDENLIHAIMVDRDSVARKEAAMDWRDRHERKHVYRQINVAQRRATERSPELEVAEADMAWIQAELGFRDVTCELLSDGVNLIPSDRVRFKILD